jgi:hypothetical protein
VPAPKITTPDAPWPGWNAVGPLETEDISRIMPDAMNRSLSTQSPVIGPLPTEDLSRIMPDAMNRSLSTKSPVGPLPTDDISRIMPDAMNRSLSARSPVGPLPTDDISRIMPDAMNRSLSARSPVGPQGTMPGNSIQTAPGSATSASIPGFPNRPPVQEPISIQSAPPPPPARQLLPSAPVLVDVTPRALVVETVGGFCDTVIPRNAKIPCEHTRVFATGRDLQTVVHVRVAQGEEQHFKDNMYLGELELSGLRPAARGEVTLSVTFELDANGSLQVRAVDTVSGREARAAMKLVAVAQTEEEIEEMIERSRSVSVTG